MNGRIGINQSQLMNSTKNMLYENLQDMGFTSEAIDNAFKLGKQKEDLDLLLSYLVKGPNGWNHNYSENKKTGLCQICQEGQFEHQQNLPLEEERLIIESEGEDDDEEQLIDYNPFLQKIVSSKILMQQNTMKFQNAESLRQSKINNNTKSTHLVLKNGHSVQKSISPQKNAETTTCKVCNDIVLLSDIKELPCKHKFCSDCIEKYIVASMNAGRFQNIKCMEEECSSVIQDEYIRTILHSDISEKFFKLKEIALLNADKNIVWCPNPDCGQYTRLDEQSQKKFSQIVCSFCSLNICLKCKRKAHAKKCCFFQKNCEEELNEEYENWASGKPVQLCPNCSVRVEKTEGCNHMECTVCNFNWCWLCRQQIIYGHYVISNPFGCPGMSGQEFTTQNSPKWKIYLKRLIILLLLFLALLIGILVIYPIVFGLYLWLRFYYYRQLPLKNYFKEKTSKCCYYVYSFFYILIGVIIFPIFMVIAIVPCLFLFLFCPPWRTYIYSSVPPSQVAMAFSIQNNLLSRLRD